MSDKRGWKRKFGEAYIKYKIRVGRGASFTAEVEGLLGAVQKGGVIILLVKAYFGYLPPIWILPLIWFGQKYFEYKMGKYDQEELHWHQFENQFASELNPWNNEVLEKINKLVLAQDKKQEREDKLNN